MRCLNLMLWSLFIFSGCTYHSQTKEPLTPVTYRSGGEYRSPESVGKLRRLAVMPVALESHHGKYASAADLDEAARNYQMACTTFLTEKKGYEIIVIQERDGMWQEHLLRQTPINIIQSLYIEWKNESAGKHSATLVQRIGNALNVDGLLAIWIKEKKPWDAFDGILNIALMNAPLFYHLSSPAMGAWIYETTSGDLVWSEQHTTMGNEQIDVTSLFLEIENAVPMQLIDPPPE